MARGNRCRPEAEAAASTDPAAREQQDSSLHPSVQANGHTAIASSLAHRWLPNPQAALLMVRELLRYSPANAGFDAWLGRITELINGVGDAPAPSHSLRPPPCRVGDLAHGAPPPPPLRDEHGGPQRGVRAREPSRGTSSLDRDEASCQIIRRTPPDVRVLLER